MVYLLKTTEVYRVDNEDEAKKLIEDAKNDGAGSLSKYGREYHEKKSKGEVVDSWYRVTLTRVFTEEKEPDGNTSIVYTD